MALSLAEGQRAQRKLLITVAEWSTGNSSTAREILGTRVEDSSIEFNADIQTSTDILGINYTDVNKTEPQQTFDPSYVIGGKALSEYLVEAALKNDIDAFNNVFTIYVITAFDTVTTGSVGDTTTSYKCVKHEHCSIIPTSLGGDAYVAMPIEVHFSNDITTGTVNSLSDDFTFTADT